MGTVTTAAAWSELALGCSGFAAAARVGRETVAVTEGAGRFASWVLFAWLGAGARVAAAGIDGDSSMRLTETAGDLRAGAAITGVFLAALAFGW
jgi:hypothetical protein